MRVREYLLTGVIAGLWIGLSTHGAIAQMTDHNGHGSVPPSSAQFRRIEQPLWVKGGMTAGGIGLIGLELWWFLVHPARSTAQVKNTPK